MEQCAPSPCQKDTTTPSSLCTRLLELWSQGFLSATQITEIAHLAILDKGQPVDLMNLAKCGSFGSQKGNCHRDVMAMFCKQIQICQPLQVSVPIKENKPNTDPEEKAGVLLPHLMFSQLHEHYPFVFEEVFGCQQCEQFWESVEKSGDDKLIPPLALDKRVQNPTQTIPCFFHGDGVEYENNNSLMVQSWGPLLTHHGALDAHLLIVAWPKACTAKGTWDILDAWISWSLGALSKGTHPTQDPWGGPLPKGLGMEELAGQPLTKGGHKAIVWCVQGDHEFFSNILHLPHWASKAPCHECDARRPVYKKKKCPKGKSVKLLLEHDQKFVRVTTEQAVAHPSSSHPLFSIEGLTTNHVRGDALHIMYCHGVGSHLTGSILHYICFFDGVGRQKLAASQRLNLVFNKICEIYKRDHVKVRMNNLRLSMICDPASPHKKFASLDSKAAECKHFCPCLLEVLQDVLDDDQEAHQQMKQSLSAFCQIIQVMDQAATIPSKQDYEKLCGLAKRFFSAYDALNKWALTKGRKIFHVTYKFHSFLHLIKNSKFLNPKAHWNFRSEDYVGRISRLGHSCAFGIKTSKVSAKITLKYRALLHLQLTRPGFTCHENTTDEP